MRVLRWVVASALLAPLVLLAPGGSAAPVTATLAPGQAAFWKVNASDEYRIAVRPGGWRLRVAYDHPDFRRGAYGVLLDPHGKEVADLAGFDSAEAFVRNPVPGIWTLRMQTSYDEVRFRAKLEKAPARAPRKATPLLPNLRLVPPHEFTFSGPVSGGRNVAIPGVGPTTCSADDVAEQHGVRCLRFSLGPANVGTGPLQLVFPPNEGLVLPGHASQLVTWSDGHVTTRAAGEFEYHKTHAHYHHSGFGKLELLKVTDPVRGTMTTAGSGPKQGFCTGDVKIADWSVFGAGMQNGADSTCMEDAGMVYDPTAGTKMGLSAGWADLYSWEQDGNYVDFGINTDGRYVVRSTADALNHVLESDESDNTSYAYIEVTGSTVKVLERGRGQSPWDRRKVIVRDGLHPNAAV